MRTQQHAETRTADVVVVGRGPVGQLVAALLARRGHSVVVLEKHRTPYRLPRAVHLTGEVLRIVDAVGAADGWERWATVPSGGAELLDADHEPLLTPPVGEPTPQGWPADIAINQPAFEDVLKSGSVGLTSLTVRTGVEVIAIEDREDAVVAVAATADGGTLRVEARYLVACDGASSPVRTMRGIPVSDTDFSADWLVVDVRSDLPFARDTNVTQVCDPRRPTSLVASGPGRRRFEFMRVGDESLETLSALTTAWSLVEPWGYHPGNAVLEKKEMYTFRARWAERWVDGRVLLAGDAAHQMPPMGGAGLTSGARDAANLVWKLDLVLRGAAGPELLDTYSSERSAHVQHAIWSSIEFGRLVCETDPELAAARDGALRALGVAAMPAAPPKRLGAGALASGHDQDAAGTLGPQGRLRTADGATLLADRLVDGFAVLVDGSRIDPDGAQRIASRLPPGLPGAVLLVVGSDEEARSADRADVRAVVDLDGVYRARFDRSAAAVEIQRPDFYVYGAATDVEGGIDLVESLRGALHLRDASLVLG